MKKEESAEPPSHPTHMKLYSLGWPRIEWQGVETSDWPSTKALALLMYLAHAKTRQPRPKLVSLLWSESPDKKAQSSLRSTLYALSKQFEGALAVDRKTVGYAPEVEIWLDTHAFRERLAGGWAQKREALSLYEGDFLAHFSVKDAPHFEQWVQEQSTTLHADAMEALLALLLHLDQHHEVEELLSWGEKCLQMEPWEERAYELMMRAYGRRGEWSQAFQLYERCAEALSRDLEIEPSRQLQKLRREIIWARDTDEPSQPRQPGDFVGREQEQRLLCEWLCEPKTHAVVIQGMGGMGKSQLARQLLPTLERRWLNGVAWLSLAEEHDPEQLSQQLAKILGLQLKGNDDIASQVPLALQDKEMILVIDAAEHLTAESGALHWLGRLLLAAPGLKLLLTSRVSMQLQQARTLTLGGLSTTTSTTETDASPLEQEAPQLLIHAIKRLDPAYDPQPDQALLLELCQELGGYPLGLSMLAPYLVSDTGRLRLASLRQDWSRLESSWLDTPERQAGLALLFDDIWEGLSPEARRIAMGFCVFADGADLNGCVAVLAGPEWEALPEHLEALQRASLLQREGGRYTMHAILRHFASGLLHEDDELKAELQRRHGHHYLSRLASTSDDLLSVHKDKNAFASREHDNLRLAWSWALEQRQWELLEQALPALYHYFETTCLFYEGNLWLTRLHQRLEPLCQRHDEDCPLSLYVHVAAYTASLRKNIGQIESGHELASRAIEYGLQVGDELAEIVAFARNVKGILEIHQGQFEAAQATLRQVLDELRDESDEQPRVRPLINLGSAYLRDGKLDEASATLREAQALCERNEWLHGLSHILNNLGMVALLKEQIDDAEGCFSRCLDVSQSIDYGYLIASSWENLAEIALRRERYDDAIARARRSREGFDELGDDDACIRVDGVLSTALLGLGQETQSIETCLSALSRAESTENLTVLMGLLCAIALLWEQQQQPHLAQQLSGFVLAQPATEQQYRDALVALQQRLPETQEQTPDEAAPTSTLEWLQRARRQLEQSLLQDAEEWRSPAELAERKKRLQTTHGG